MTAEPPWDALLWGSKFTLVSFGSLIEHCSLTMYYVPYDSLVLTVFVKTLTLATIFTMHWTVLFVLENQLFAVLNNTPPLQHNGGKTD